MVKSVKDAVKLLRKQQVRPGHIFVPWSEMRELFD